MPPPINGREAIEVMARALAPEARDRIAIFADLIASEAATLQEENAKLQSLLDSATSPPNVPALSLAPRMEAPPTPVQAPLETASLAEVPPPKGELLTTEEAAKRLGWSVSPMHRLGKHGFVRRWPPGQTTFTRIPAEDLDWIKENRDELMGHRGRAPRIPSRFPTPALKPPAAGDAIANTAAQGASGGRRASSQGSTTQWRQAAART